MLMPKRVKYRKVHIRGLKASHKATKGDKINFGDYALKAISSGYITARQIESARITIARYIKKGGKIWIRIFPNLSITSKPAETRMGGGKGSPEYWVAKIHAGKVLFEISGVKKEDAKEALRLASYKLSVKTKFCERTFD